LESNSELEQFSTVVEKVYDATLDQNLWTVALEDIADLVGADCAGIHFADMEKISMGPTNFHTIGFTESFNQKIFEYAQVWALQSGLPYWVVGDVHHLPDIMPHEELINGRFYKEVLSKEDQDDYMGMLAVKDGSRIVPVTLATERATGAFLPRGIELMRMLSSHICKAAKISYALELKSLKIDLLENTLDSLSTAIYLVHHDGRVVFMNQAAEKQVRRGIGLKIINDRVTPNDSAAAVQFLDRMSRESEDEASPVSIALPDENGGLLATILRLDKGLRQNFAKGANPALFAIFVQNPEVALPVPGAGFAKLYGLSNAELRITLAMAPGLGPQDAADTLGLSLSTVKTHLQNIFAKTGTSKQADLMQLLMRATAPLAAK
jgi:DNA-binding CsgD family transcriptional regulator/PAS domain-containing protein